MATRSSTPTQTAVIAAAPFPGVWQAFRHRFARWQDANRIADELHLLSARELADLGLSQSDVTAVIRGTYRRD